MKQLLLLIFVSTLCFSQSQVKTNLGWIKLGESDITNLTTDLAGKQSAIGNIGDTTKYLKATAVKNGAYFDTTTYTRGTVTIPKGDSIQVSITGLTSTSIATVAYVSAQMTADTVASWRVVTSGKLSIYGKFNKIISYIVGR